jgi:outer membrane protein
LNNHGWGLNLNQSVINLSNWYTFQSAKASDRAAAVNLAAQEQDLIMRVAMAYFDVLRAQELLETNLQEEGAALRSLEQTRQREEVGLVAITDVFDSQAAFDLARNTTILQRDLLRSRYEALEAITGQPHGNIDELRADFPILEVDGSLIAWEDQAEDNSLAIAAARYNLDASRKTLRARKSDHLPTVDIAGQYGHNVTAPIVSQGIQIGGGAFDRSSLALSVSIPLYSGGAVSARRRQAEQNVVAAQESLELTKRQLTQNIRNAYRRVNTDVLVIDQRQQSINSAQLALDATELGAEVGTRNIVEVLRARENLFRALRQYADARFDYVLDTLVLKQVAGILTPEDIIQLNEWLQGEG